MSADGIRNSGGLKIDMGKARERQTPKTDFGTVMKAGVAKTADAVMGAGQLAAPFVPGGAVLSAAISGVGGLKQSMGAQTSGGAGNGLGAGITGASGNRGGAMASVEARAAAGDEVAGNLVATREMQQMNQSFNLQYLQLQQKMQGDNRQFTALSNIMKTKHDTAKNAIGNVR